MRRAATSHGGRFSRIAAASLLTFLVGAWATGLPGCAREKRPQLVALSTDRPMSAPVRLARSGDGHLVAVVSEGDPHRLALWRADSLGAAWQHWAWLADSAPSGNLDLAVAGGHVCVAGSEASRIRISRLPISAPLPADGQVQEVSIETEGPVNCLDLAASPFAPRDTGAAGADSLTGRAEWLHLVYAARLEGDSASAITYRRSPDAGLSWSEPRLLAAGMVGRPALYARPDPPGMIDACYAREGFMAWRGSNDSGAEWIPEKSIRLRVAPGARVGVARSRDEVLVVCENDIHQVAGAVSLNGGYNWERAIAIARNSDHLRLPSLDRGGGRFWTAFSQGDSAVVVRAASHGMLPKQWHPGIVAAPLCCLDAPAIAALPDSSVALLFAVPGGTVYFTRVRDETQK